MVLTRVTCLPLLRTFLRLGPLLCILLVGCVGETPADGFVRFVKACTSRDAEAAFGRLSPQTQQLVTLSSARHAAQHPERRMSPAQFMFAEESIGLLAQGFSKVNEVARQTVASQTWAVLHVTNIEGDVAQVFMVRAGDRWLLHTAMPPDSVLEASRLAVEEGAR